MTEEASQDPRSAGPLRFQSGGAVRPGAFYIEREADTELINTLLAGEYCYVLAPRQMGKSSLRVRAAQKLRERGIRCATVDLQKVGSDKKIPINDWYYSVIQLLNSGLGLNLDLDTFWKEQGQHLTDPNAVGRTTLAHAWSTFLEREVLAHTTERIVIFVDEIDSVLSLDFSADDFFAAIRSAHESRPEYPEYNRLTFCLMGVAAPNDLIRDTTRTPFNIGKSISLEDFTWPQTQKFLNGLSQVNGNGIEYLRSVFSWANGQPYMTHKLCQEIARLDGKSSGASEADIVRNLVETIFLQRGRTDDANLRYAEDRFDKITASATKSQLLQLYRRLLKGQHVEVKTANPAQSELKLTGLAAEKHDANGTILQRRNEIFATVFDEKWIREKEGERLFREALAKWLEVRERGASGEEYLLRGEALEEGLAWWRQRDDVTKEEREFLLASQELARTKAVKEARWAKRLKTLSGLLIIALIVAFAFAWLARINAWEANNKNTLLVASQAKLTEANQNLAVANSNLQKETEAAQAARTAAENAQKEAKAAEEVALEKAKELQTANAALDKARASATTGLKRSYFASGNYEFDDRKPLQSAAYYVASHGLIDPKYPDDTDSLIPSKLEVTEPFVHPLIENLSNSRFSPDGKRLLSIGITGVQLWDTQSSKIISDKIAGEVLPLNPWSPDSQWFITSADGDYILWNAQTGDGVASLPGTGGSILYWSNDSKRLVSSGDSITLWNAESGTQIAKLIEKKDEKESEKESEKKSENEADPYKLVAWAQDSKRLATVNNGILQLWDSKDGRPISQLLTNFNLNPFDEVNDSVLIGGDRIFITYTQDSLKLWDADRGSLREELSRSQNITNLVLSTNSEILVGLDNGAIRLWNTKDGSALALPGKVSTFQMLGTDNSLRIITVDSTGEAKLWNAKTGKHMKDLPIRLSPDAFSTAFLVPGNRERFALSNQESVQLWDSKTGKLLRTLPLKLFSSQALIWSNDDKWLIIQTSDNNKAMPAQIWDADTGRPVTMLPVLEGFNSLGEVSWTAGRFTTAQNDGFVNLWELRFAPLSVPEMIQNINQYSPYRIVKSELIYIRQDAAPRQ